MSEHDMTPLTPDEALHAFMDGELELTNEQSLFDELAASPELRSEMKDALAIRDAVHQDLMSPPASVESGLLAGLGFATGAGAGTAASGAAAAAAASTVASGSAWLSRTLYTVGGSIAGFVLAWMLFSDTNSGTMATTGPVVTGPTPTEPVRVDTVFAVKYVAQRPAVTNNEPVQSLATAQPTEITTEITTEPTPETTTEESVATIIQPEAVPYRTSSFDVTMRKADLMSPGTSAPPVTFRLRTLASGLSNSQTIPSSVQDAILPNTAFALLMPIGNGQRLGVEMGTESWQQTFTGTEEGRPVEITQTPVLFWMGATYQIQPTEFRFLPGLSPFADATLGVAFAQGPVGRATVGLAYQPFGPIRFTVGVDGSALMYQYQNAWFTSTKWGMSYGISFDIGALR